jgi:hypothetical protein
MDEKEEKLIENSSSPENPKEEPIVKEEKQTDLKQNDKNPKESHTLHCPRCSNRPLLHRQRSFSDDSILGICLVCHWKGPIKMAPKKVENTTNDYNKFRNHKKGKMSSGGLEGEIGITEE